MSKKITPEEKKKIIAMGKKEEEDDDTDLEDETEEEESEEESEEEAGSEEESEDESEKDSEEDIDYEEIARLENERAEEERLKREKAEKALAGKAFNKRKNKREGNEEDEDVDDEDKPLTRRELHSVLSEFSQESSQKSQETEAMNIARKNTSSEKEAQAALVFYKNRIRHTGNVEEDVQFAIAGMNRKRTVAEKSEITRALKSKDNKSKDFAGTHREGAPAEKGKVKSADQKALAASGMVYDSAKRLYKKALPNGKFFYYDPKSKRRWTK